MHHRTAFTGNQSVHGAISHHVDFCNNPRLHSARGYQSPGEDELECS